MYLFMHTVLNGKLSEELFEALYNHELGGLHTVGANGI